ncbi:MAG: DNA-protecting protein DprA [Paucibacter sp.]|nr:DNA-protecting protein DprA [Roseateles sp.]
MVEREELAAWLRLLETPGVGLETARARLAQAGSLDEALEQLPAPPPHLPALIEQTWAWLQADTRHDLLTLADADYPPLLMQTADPPLLLYLDGRRELLRAQALAIVGSRHPTPQGREHAEAFGHGLAAAGLVIVSGLALGVDGAAHQGALEAGGGTIAIVGTGLDQIYPRRHEALGQRIRREGLILSEYALATPPLASNFPRRNRLIAGLTRGCLVVEAALQSGSLITARLASQAGREVFAIPGSTHSAHSRGCHALIRQGAKLVESPADVLEKLQLGLDVREETTPDAPEPGWSPALKRLLGLMGYEPVSLEELLNRGAGTSSEVSAWLLELQLAGLVSRLAGQVFQRRART